MAMYSPLGYTASAENGNFLDIIKNDTLRKYLLICFVLIASQELSGFSVITYHLESIFSAAGSVVDSNISALIVGFVLFMSSFISPFLVDRSGRKKLIIWSCTGMCLSLASLGAFFYIQDVVGASTKNISWIPIASLVSYIIFFNIGICSIPWTLTSELFPSNARKAAATSSSFCNWIVSFTTLNVFNSMIEVLGRSGTFWCFAVLSLCSTIFAAIFVPETKGKSFMEIQETFLSGKQNNIEVKNMKIRIEEEEKGNRVLESTTVDGGR